MKELKRQDISDILHGSAILGAGGGGELSEGFGLIDEALAAGKSFKLASVDEIADDAIVCTPYLLGAISELTVDQEEQYAGLPRSGRHPILIAYDEFQSLLGCEFSASTPCELGGSNTAVAFYCAAMNGHYVVDADPAGRAVPEITHSTYYLAGLPASPIIAVNEFGEKFILDQIKDDQRAETLVRALCQVSRNDIAVIDHALPMRTLKNVLISGTISKAMQLGKIWRNALHKPESVADAIVKFGGGCVCFKGQVTQADYRTGQGFTLGSILISGIESFNKQSFKISVKNENMVGWLNDSVCVTIPDLICLIDADTGHPVNNPNASPGLLVSVVLLPSPDVFRTTRGLNAFGPAYAGVDVDYQPI